VFGMGTGGAPAVLSPCFRIDRSGNQCMNHRTCGDHGSHDGVVDVGRIRSARLKASLPVHLRPINLVIFQESIGSHLVARFALICFQRLSEPYIATRPCPWQDSRYTSGTFVPVLSY
jgi:hypothetical protein